MARALDLKSVDPEFKSTGFVAGVRSPWFRYILLCLLPVGILYLLSLLELFPLKGSGQ